MNKRYIEDLKQIKKHAWSDLIFILLAILSFGFSILFFISYHVYGFIPFVIFILSVIQLILSHRKIKLAKHNLGNYYEFTLQNSYTYESLKTKLLNIKNVTKCFNHDDKSSIFFVKEKVKMRFLICNVSNFNKSEFYKTKKSVNKVVNKKYEISQWLPRDVVTKMVRINLIFTDKMNNNLKNLLSINAEALLRRNEAIINVAFINDKLIVPPVAGDLVLGDVLRYKKVVEFLIKHF